MAEGYIRHFGGEQMEVYSAGIETHGVNPRAIESMKADGLDISNHTSNNVSEYIDLSFDLILTVCDNAKENCPYIPGNASRLHHDFPDPSGVIGDEEVVRKAFNTTRNMIKAYILEHIEDWR
jgi:arsenate reductase